MNFAFKIKKTSRRKTISFIIKDGFVLVLSPKYITESYIQKLLIKKEKWIEKKLKEQTKNINIKEKKFKNGECLFYFGEKLTLYSYLNKDTSIKINQGILHVGVKRKNSNLKKIIESWYINQIQKYVEHNIYKISNQMYINFNSIKYRNYKRKLGSCNLTGDLAFNWRIVMIPKEVINYILVHELCHIKHFNHSKDFWHMVGEYIPEYKNYNIWLKKNINMMHW